MDTLKERDVIMWRGNFGTAAPEKAVVTSIEITHGGKEGDSVPEVAWSRVFGRNVVVSLDNGHWAYGGQISPLEGK